MALTQEKIDAILKRLIKNWEDLDDGQKFNARSKIVDVMNAAIAEGWKEPDAART